MAGGRRLQHPPPAPVPGHGLPGRALRPDPDVERAALPLRLPAALTAAPSPPPDPPTPARVRPFPSLPPTPGAVEFDRVVPAAGNLWVAGKQFWLGPARAGITVTFWADHDVIHLPAGGARLKTVRSHLTDNDLAPLAAPAAVPPAHLPSRPPRPTAPPIEVDRLVSRSGSVGLAGREFLTAEILAGRRSPFASTATSLPFFDPYTRDSAASGPAPSPTPRPSSFAGPAPPAHRRGPRTSPSGSNAAPPTRGSIMVAGQKLSLGRVHAHTAVTVYVAETTLTIEAAEDTWTVARTTTTPVRYLKAPRPRKATL